MGLESVDEFQRIYFALPMLDPIGFSMTLFMCLTFPFAMNKSMKHWKYIFCGSLQNKEMQTWLCQAMKILAA